MNKKKEIMTNDCVACENDKNRESLLFLDRNSNQVILSDNRNF